MLSNLHFVIMICVLVAKKKLSHTIFYTVPSIYAALRPTLLTSIANLISPAGINYDLLLHLDQGRIIEIILKGSPDLSYAVNTQIFKAVQDFIKMTKCFDCWINWRIKYFLCLFINIIVILSALSPPLFFFVLLYLLIPTVYYSLENTSY